MTPAYIEPWDFSLPIGNDILGFARCPPLPCAYTVNDSKVKSELSKRFLNVLCYRWQT